MFTLSYIKCAIELGRRKNDVKVRIINKNSANVRVTAVRARQAPKIIKMNIIEKRRKAKRRIAKRRIARYYCICYKYCIII
jgi:hypothetical protein